MPGFSQQSYNRIHGFKLEQIKCNINTIVNNLEKEGLRDRQILYHLYQFNLGEISNAKEFARELNIGIAAFGAYFNGHTMFRDYLTKNMTSSALQMARSELITDYIDDKFRRGLKITHVPN